MDKFNFKSKIGFTLIELLVAIGILAVLAAIAIPSVAGLIDRANVSSDKTNANEYTNAIERFASEYELFCQDIASGTFDVNNMDSTQSRVYNSLNIEDRSGIESVEVSSNAIVDDYDISIYRDTKYPANAYTTLRIVQNYTKTSSSTFEPKQSDMHFWYSPDCGTVVVSKPNSSNSVLNAMIISGINAKGQSLNDETIWIDLTEGVPPRIPAACGIEGHWENDGKDHSKMGSMHSAGNGTHMYKCQCTTFTIPEGAKFVSYRGQNGKTVWEAGETISCPYTLRDYDKYYYGDYVYHISTGYSPDNGWVVSINTAITNKNQETYGPILDEILGRNVSVMPRTFEGCKNLKTAPKIPKYIFNMENAFYGCSALEQVPDLSQCVKLNSMWATFSGCTTIINASNMIIPKTVTNMNNTFDSCFNMVVGPNMSNADGITTMRYTFSGCRSLVNSPIISQKAKIKDMSSAFMSCTSLKTAPHIPSTVTDLTYAFSNCKSLEVAPKIPNSVLKMGSTFSNCTSLSGTIEINANPESYSSCFNGINFEKQNLNLAGNSELLDTLGQTSYGGYYYCNICNGKCFCN